MKRVIISADAFSIADIHELLAEKLEFPDYYGKNLDALRDCLGDISEETHIFLADGEILKDRLGIAYEKLLRVLHDSARENDDLHIEVLNDR